MVCPVRPFFCILREAFSGLVEHVVPLLCQRAFNWLRWHREPASTKTDLEWKCIEVPKSKCSGLLVFKSHISSSPGIQDRARLTQNRPTVFAEVRTLSRAGAKLKAAIYDVLSICLGLGSPQIGDNTIICHSKYLLPNNSTDSNCTLVQIILHV